MFVHQKFDYVLHNGTNFSSFQSIKDFFDDMTAGYENAMPEYVVLDTETSGLNVLEDYPFLCSIAFGKDVYVFSIDREVVPFLNEFLRKPPMVFAHNAKYDYHMLLNAGLDLSDVRIVDSMVVARLTQYADVKERLSLEHIGMTYVDESSKSEKKVISNRISELDRAQKKYAREVFTHAHPGVPFTTVFEAYKNRVQYVKNDMDEYFETLDACYYPSGYLSVHLAFPNIMLNYAADDAVILLEYLKKALVVLKNTDPGWATFNRENLLLPHIVQMERTGMRVDIDYLLESRERVIAYRQKLREDLYNITGEAFSVAQHDYIKKMFARKFNRTIISADERTLEEVAENTTNETLKQVVSLILELRSVENKILSTYIEGKLNSINPQSGRIHTEINSSGAVTGRVSSDMQQQPNDPILDRDGNELFHPRKAFIADEDSNLVFIDFNQMELRVQANYTLLIGEGDTNLCRAYIPLGYHSKIDGKMYDPENPEHYANCYKPIWVNEKGELWKENDLHGITTLKAFPHLNNDTNHPDFAKLRKQGKRCNFLKIYQGGVKALIRNIGVSEEVAKALDKAFYDAFPKVKDYQNWVTNSLLLHGYVENMYGRRYYMQDQRWFYKASNYLIQGTCADLVKSKEYEVCEFLKGKKSKFLLPIHDELVFSIPDDEMWIIPELVRLMSDTRDVIKYIPMTVEVSTSRTNWAEKVKVKL